MEKVGIICEYNPFHNGHIYHLKKVKEMFPDSFITLILSSCFTERGEVSFLTKWEKTKIALDYGVDLVIELPFIFATQSADIFASHAVFLLEKLGINYLVFGSETDDIDVFKNLARTMLYSKEYDKLVKKFLDLGNNYPASIAKALYDLTEAKINYSNDILAISYVKAIMLNDFKITPITIKRTNNYLSQELNEHISSATSIRKAYLEGIDIQDHVPKETLELLNINKNYLDNFFYLLKYKLINEANNLDDYLDVSEGIDKRIKKYIFEAKSYQELLDLIKTKRYTYTRLNRMFLHILMNLKKDEKDKDINYIRVLGFNKIGKKYLKFIKDKIDLPIITNYKDIDDFVLKFELKATTIYLYIINKEYLLKEELKSIPIIKED